MRRSLFLASLAAAGTAASVPATAAPGRLVKLEIRNTAWEIRSGLTVDIAAYKGAIPGPMLRLGEGERISVSVHNRTAKPQTVHWHGLVVSDLVDGVAELGTPAVPPNGTRTYEFTVTPGGTRWYHAHSADGLFSGMFGPLIVERKQERSDYDREVVLMLHEFAHTIETVSPSTPVAYRGAPTLALPAMGMGGMGAMRGMMGGMGPGGMMGMMGPMTIARYAAYAINGKALGANEPIRVRSGERIRFRIINASATLTHRLALPGHRFLVSERVDAIVTMQAPGVWVLGSTDPYARSKGLGIVIAYGGRSGAPQWRDNAQDAFTYGRFASAGKRVAIDAAFDFTLQRAPDRLDRWTINGEEFPNVPPVNVRSGLTYLLRFRNLSMIEHPFHAHGHGFELLRVDGASMSGVVKDTVVVRPMGGQVEVALKAANPYGGRFLLHCHNEQHMQGGMATVIAYN